HGTSLIELRQELRVRETRSDGQQGVAVAHHLVAGPGAEQPDRTGDVRTVIADDVLAQQSLRDPGTEQIGDGDEFVARAPGSGAGEDRHFLALVENRRGTLD